MKFKVGDKVRLMKNSSATHGFKVGEIYKIVDISNKGDRYPIKITNQKIYGFVNNKHIQKMSEQCYTYKDLKKSPIGTKVTFENGSVLVKTREGRFENYIDHTYIEYLKKLEDNSHGKIIKIEKPEYKTVYEYKLEVLDEVEKRYLRGVIRPFRDKVAYIEKYHDMSEKLEFINIAIKSNSDLDLPYFKKNSMYKGMKLRKKYTLEELGL